MTRSAGALQAADRKVLDRARGLHAVVRVGGDVQLAERIALDAERMRRSVDSPASQPLSAQLYCSYAALILRQRARSSSSGPRPICRPTCARR